MLKERKLYLRKILSNPIREIPKIAPDKIPIITLRGDPPPGADTMNRVMKKMLRMKNKILKKCKGVFTGTAPVKRDFLYCRCENVFCHK